MANTMTRSEAQRKVDDLYKKIHDEYSRLKPRERELDDKRAEILRTIEGLLIVVSNNEEYKKQITLLDDDGFRTYAEMLSGLLNKMRYGGRNIVRKLWGSDFRYDRGYLNLYNQKQEITMRAAGPVHAIPREEKAYEIININDINSSGVFINAIKKGMDFLANRKELRPDMFMAHFNKTANTILGISLKEVQPTKYRVEGNIQRWEVTNSVRNEINNERSEPDAKTFPLNAREERQYYFPREFPGGIWNIEKSVPKNDDIFGKVYIPTTAYQSVSVYGPVSGAKPVKTKEGRFIPTDTQQDTAYGLHFSESGTTQGCIKFDSQPDADRFARITDSVIAKSGIATLIADY